IPRPNPLDRTFVVEGMVRPPSIPTPLWNTIPPDAQAAILALVASLERRISELEAENADLRRRLAQVEHQLQHFRERGQRIPNHRHDPDTPPTDHRCKEHRTHPGFSDRSPRPALSSSNTTSVRCNALIAAPASSNPPLNSKTTSWPISPNPDRMASLPSARLPLLV